MAYEVEIQIPCLAALFSLSMPEIWYLKSPSVSDVSTGKLCSAAEVFSDTAHTLMAGMKCGLPQMLCLLQQTDEFSTANV